jgi:NAD(P)-dependent dehydrogenase (short-subunit alcohol dehydrogenase family)
MALTRHSIGHGVQMKPDILEAVGILPVWTDLSKVNDWQMDINLLSAVFTTNAFLPLIRKGEVKKIIIISSGMAGENVILTTELPFTIGYAAAKAGLNAIVAKYAVQLKGEGIISLSLSPG